MERKRQRLSRFTEEQRAALGLPPANPQEASTAEPRWNPYLLLDIEEHNARVAEAQRKRLQAAREAEEARQRRLGLVQIDDEEEDRAERAAQAVIMRDRRDAERRASILMREGWAYCALEPSGPREWRPKTECANIDMMTRAWNKRRGLWRDVDGQRVEWSPSMFPYPFSTWPVHHREQLLARHKGMDDRRALFNFFWQNGMPAEFAMYWVLWHGGYDRKAIDQMNHLVRQTKSVEGRKKFGDYFDLLLRRVVRQIVTMMPV